MCIFTIDIFFCSVLCVCCATPWFFLRGSAVKVLTDCPHIDGAHIRLVAKPRMTNFNPNSVTLIYATFLKNMLSYI